MIRTNTTFGDSEPKMKVNGMKSRLHCISYADNTNRFRNYLDKDGFAAAEVNRNSLTEEAKIIYDKYRQHVAYATSGMKKHVAEQGVEWEVPAEDQYINHSIPGSVRVLSRS